MVLFFVPQIGHVVCPPKWSCYLSPKMVILFVPHVVCPPKWTCYLSPKMVMLFFRSYLSFKVVIKVIGRQKKGAVDFSCKLSMHGEMLYLSKCSRHDRTFCECPATERAPPVSVASWDHTHWFPAPLPHIICCPLTLSEPWWHTSLPRLYLAVR